MGTGWKPMAKFIMALIYASFFWIPGSESAWAKRPAGQGIFHAYTKPMRAPVFSLENLQGKMVNTMDYRGQIILLNFWATW